MKKVNELYELIEDVDLNSDKGYETMILQCPKCRALFKMKACGNRSLFPWFGYHPTDGNCQVLTDEFKREVEKKADSCDCNAKLTKIKTKIALDSAIESL